MLKRFVIVLLRGSLGGACGGLLWVGAPVIANLGQSGVQWDWFGVAYVLVGLPFGVIIGGLVAVTLSLIQLEVRVVRSAIVRVTVGTLIAMVLLLLFFWWHEEPAGYVKSSWQRNLLGIFLLGAAMGGLSGLMVGRQGLSRITD